MLICIMALPRFAFCTPIKRNSFPLFLLWFTRFGCDVLWMIQIAIIVTVIVVIIVVIIVVVPIVVVVVATVTTSVGGI